VLHIARKRLCNKLVGYRLLRLVRIRRLRGKAVYYYKQAILYIGKPILLSFLLYLPVALMYLSMA
jgi:hypothetical protein